MTTHDSPGEMTTITIDENQLESSKVWLQGDHDLLKLFKSVPYRALGELTLLIFFHLTIHFQAEVIKIECDKLFHLKRNYILKVSSVRINV